VGLAIAQATVGDAAANLPADVTTTRAIPPREQPRVRRLSHSPSSRRGSAMSSRPLAG